MRYHFIDEMDGGEILLDLRKTTLINPATTRFEFAQIKDNKPVLEKKIILRKLAGKYFVSEDGTSWEKVASEELPHTILNINRNYKLFRGFKPSSLAGSEGSDLVNHIPGLVVKIFVKQGQKVEKGEPLLILEAMKMENKINSVADGIVKNIFVREGQALEKGTLLMELEKNG